MITFKAKGLPVQVGGTTAAELADNLRAMVVVGAVTWDDAGKALRKVLVSPKTEKQITREVAHLGALYEVQDGQG